MGMRSALANSHHVQSAAWRRQYNCSGYALAMPHACLGTYHHICMYSLMYSRGQIYLSSVRFDVQVTA